MARPINTAPLPYHAAIHVPSPPIIKRMYGNMVPIAIVTCPVCGKIREYPVGQLRSLFKQGQRFTGLCQSCFMAVSRRALAEKRRKNPVMRTVLRSGYVVVSEASISDEDVPMFNDMKAKSKYVFEHRWIMAKHLGRALSTRELVDHMDGKKANNELSNLRLYRKGKNDPGETNGYGTFYHEWQMAEARIRELETLLPPATPLY